MKGVIQKSQQCGWIQDQFGFSWQIVPDMGKWLQRDDKAANDKALKAMRKIVLEGDFCCRST